MIPPWIFNETRDYDLWKIGELKEYLDNWIEFMNLKTKEEKKQYFNDYHIHPNWNWAVYSVIKDLS